MRVRGRVAAAVATVVVLTAVASCAGAAPLASSPPSSTSTSTSTSTPTTPPTTPPALALPAVAVGDSVLEDVELYAPQTLTAHGITIDAAVGRQWAAGVQILTLLREAGQLPPVVIVALGSNGRITAALFDQMMQVCSGAKRVVFMTVTGPLIANNAIITAGVARYAPRAVLADWHTLASAHPEWFAADKVHVGPAGARALGTLLARVG